jgi:hypothetical protein
MPVAYFSGACNRPLQQALLENMFDMFEGQNQALPGSSWHNCPLWQLATHTHPSFLSFCLSSML